MKNDYNQRKKKMYSNHSIGETSISEGKKPVVGILDARMALKKNMHSSL